MNYMSRSSASSTQFGFYFKFAPQFFRSSDRLWNRRLSETRCYHRELIGSIQFFGKMRERVLRQDPRCPVQCYTSRDGMESASKKFIPRVSTTCTLFEREAEGNFRGTYGGIVMFIICSMGTTTR